MDKGEKTTWWTVGKIGMILIIRVMQKKTVWQEEKCHKRAKGQNCDSRSKKSCSKQRIGRKKVQTFTVKICKSNSLCILGKQLTHHQKMPLYTQKLAVTVKKQEATLTEHSLRNQWNFQSQQKSSAIK